MDIIVKAAPKDDLGEAIHLLEKMRTYSYPSGLAGELLRERVQRFLDAHQGDGSGTSE